MSHEESMHLMQGLADARSLVSDLRMSCGASNSYAWTKLYSISTYLGNEQIELGRKTFADPDVEGVLIMETAT